MDRDILDLSRAWYREQWLFLHPVEQKVAHAVKGALRISGFTLLKVHSRFTQPSLKVSCNTSHRFASMFLEAFCITFAAETVTEQKQLITTVTLVMLKYAHYFLKHQTSACELFSTNICQLRTFIFRFQPKRKFTSFYS